MGRWVAVLQSVAAVRWSGYHTLALNALSKVGRCFLRPALLSSAYTVIVAVVTLYGLSWNVTAVCMLRCVQSSLYLSDIFQETFELE